MRRKSLKWWERIEDKRDKWWKEKEEIEREFMRECVGEIERRRKEIGEKIDEESWKGKGKRGKEREEKDVEFWGNMVRVKKKLEIKGERRGSGEEGKEEEGKKVDRKEK